MKKFFSYICLSLILSLIYAETFIKPDNDISAKHYVCYQTNNKLDIDGKMEENDWQEADWTEYFIDIEGDKKTAPFLKSRVKMLYDQDYFYVFAYMEENDLWATLRNHDDIIYQDNDFEIFIDPDGDTHDYYEIEINALNTIWDLFIIKPYRDRDQVAIDAWDIKGLKSAVYLKGSLNDNRDKDEYWSVEMAIPWKVLAQSAHKNTPPKKNDLWRINFSRVQYLLDKEGNSYKKQQHPEFNWVWSNQGIIAMHFPEQWGYVQFSDLKVSKIKDFIKLDPLHNEKKWLRQIYYAEKQYFLNYNCFTKSLKKLNLASLIDKKNYDIEIYTTPNTYEIILTNKFNKQKVYLYRDGRILDKLDFH